MEKKLMDKKLIDNIRQGANAMEHLIEELAQKEARIRELEEENSSLMMQNSVLMDVVKVPFLADKKSELTLAKKWEMSLSQMKGLITELYGDEAYLDKPNEKEARISQLEAVLEYVYLRIVGIEDDPIEDIMIEFENMKTSICSRLGRTPEENDLWQNKSNQSDKEE